MKIIPEDDGLKVIMVGAIGFFAVLIALAIFNPQPSSKTDKPCNCQKQEQK